MEGSPMVVHRLNFAYSSYLSLARLRTILSYLLWWDNMITWLDDLRENEGFNFLDSLESSSGFEGIGESNVLESSSCLGDLEDSKESNVFSVHHV